MFVGVYERQLDERGRVALPSSFRGDLGEHCYLFFGDDGCVSVRSEESFQEQAAELIEQVKRGEVSRDRKRAFASSADARHDRQAGSHHPRRPAARARGDRATGRRVVLGSLDQIEIWNPQTYRASEAAGQHEIAGTAR